MISPVYEQKGTHDEAAAAAEKGWRLSKVNTESLAYSLASGRQNVDARSILAQLNELSSTRYVPPYSFALANMGLGEKEKALDYLERGITERCEWHFRNGMSSSRSRGSSE